MVTIEEIREIGQSGKLFVAKFPYSGHVLRKISPYFTKFFVEHNVSANQITFCSIMLGIIANLMFVFGNYALMLLGCVFYQFWDLFDCVDGEVARVTNVKTLGGKYLETISEVIIHCGFMACLGIGLSQILNNNTFIFLGLTFALFICLLDAFALTRDVTMEQMRKRRKEDATTKEMSYAKRFYKKARLFFVVRIGYLVLAVIVIFEFFSPIKLYFEIFGQTLSILSIYFLLYGFVCIVRTIVSGITNYQYLMRS